MLIAPKSFYLILNAFKHYDESIGLSSVLDCFDYCGLSTNDVYLAVLGRPANLQELCAFDSHLEIREQYEIALNSCEFQTNSVKNCLNAFSEKRRLLFVHIPKCSGSSVNSHLISKYPAILNWIANKDITSRSGLFTALRDFAVAMANIDAKAIFVYGHVPLMHYIDNGFIRKDDLLFTTIRDPFEIVISHVNYVMTKLRNPALKEESDVLHWKGFLNIDLDSIDDANLVNKIIYNQGIHPHHNNFLCSFLGRGTYKSAKKLIADSKILIIPIEQLDTWLAENFDIHSNERFNVSNKYISSATITNKDREYITKHLINEDVLLFDFLIKRQQESTLQIGLDREKHSSGLKFISAVLRENEDVVQGQLMTFDVDFILTREINELEMGIHIFDERKELVFGVNSSLLKQVHINVACGSYRVMHYVNATLPAGKYTAGFAFTELLPTGNRPLLWLDNVCKFQISNRSDHVGVGYAGMQAAMECIPTNLAQEGRLVFHPVGSLISVNPFQTMFVGERIALVVEVTNRSEQLWLGSVFYPIKLSYHWLDNAGEMVIFDGCRTELPAGGVPPWQTVRAKVSVVAPAKKGNYKLVVSLVQESYAWFDELGEGFQPAILEVMVGYTPA